MISREATRRVYREKRKQQLEEKMAASFLVPEEKIVKSKLRSQGIDLNYLVQLDSPIRHGYVRSIGENAGLDQNCDFYVMALKAKEKNMGENNDTFRGIKYFNALEKGGFFCKRGKIKRIFKRAALSEVETALNKLPQMEEEKILVFAEHVRRLTRLLSIGNIGGLNPTFERARRKSGFTLGTSPFTLSGGRLPKVNSHLSLATSPSTSYSYSSLEEAAVGIEIPEGFEYEENEISKQESGSKKTVNVTEKPPSQGAEELVDDQILSAPQLKRKKTSQFLLISPRNDTLGEIMANELSEDYFEDLKQELEEDFALYCVSQETRKGLNSMKDVQELIINLQICINVLKKHIPKVTEVLDVSDENNTIYMTNVIQDLLKRAQEEKLSKKILTDFSGIRKLDFYPSYSASDVSALVETMAWVRNNLCVAGLTDENDAKMTLMGAEEVQQSLAGILKRVGKIKTKTEKLSIEDICQSGVLSKKESGVLAEQSDAQAIEFENIITSDIV